MFCLHILLSQFPCICTQQLLIYLPPTSSTHFVQNKCPTRSLDKNRALAHFRDLCRVLCLVIVYVLTQKLRRSFIILSDYKLICTVLSYMIFYTNSFFLRSTVRLSQYKGAPAATALCVVEDYKIIRTKLESGSYGEGDRSRI